MESVIENLRRVRLGGTGYVFDERMCGHQDPSGPHPEDPKRIKRIHEELQKRGLLERCVKIPIRPITREELLSVHTAAHCDAMDRLDAMSLKERDLAAYKYNSIFFNEHSLEAAKLAAGATVVLTEAVMTGKIANGVAIVRPPGHHAEADEAMGFCMYNQVAVAAALARQKWGANRVAIIDWDVHFGNGTYNSFADDNTVLYVSTHRYQNGMFYPAGKTGAPTVVGTGKGQGYSVHIGWDSGYIGDGGYLAAFETVIMPICREFNPDLVLISAGFDAAAGDPLGGCQISPRGYAHMTHMLSTLAGGRVVLVLEGGYNLTSISTSFAACTATLLGDELPSLGAVQPELQSAKAIMQTVEAHAPFWACMKNVARVTTFPGYVSTTDTSYTPTVSPVKVTTTRNAEPSSPAAVPEPAGSSASTSASSASTSAPSASTSASSASTSAPSASTAASSASTQVAPQMPAETPATSSAAATSTAATTATSTNNSHDNAASASTSAQTAPPSVDGKYSADTGFAVEPLRWCPHLDLLSELSAASIVFDARAGCADCGDLSENWVCLHCQRVFCSRFVRRHMLAHYDANRSHTLALSFSDISVWCYECDAYVHNDQLAPFKTAAYTSKFGA